MLELVPDEISASTDPWGVFGSQRSGVQPASVCSPRCVGLGYSQIRIQIKAGDRSF